MGITAYVCNSAKTLLGSASFSGTTATFSSPIAITAGSNYYVVVSSSTRRYGTAAAFPRTKTDITYSNTAYATTAGNLSTLVTGIGEDCAISDIQTQSTTNTGAGFLLMM